MPIDPEISLQYVLTPRPPVALKEARRASTDDTLASGWTTILQVAEYENPATQAVTSVRYVLSRVTLTTATGSATTVAVRVVDALAEVEHDLFPEITVPATGFLDLPVKSAVLSAQEVLQVKALGAVEVHVNASYVKATREEFKEIV
jgi:hypothetical protein